MTCPPPSGGQMHRQNRGQTMATGCILKCVFEKPEALGFSILEPKPESQKRGHKPKDPKAVKPKRSRGRSRKDANQSVGLL